MLSFLGILAFSLSNIIFAEQEHVPFANVGGSDISHRCENGINEAEIILSNIKDEKNLDSSHVLLLYNEIEIILGDILSEAGLLSQVHPNPDIRKDAENCEKEASKFATEISLDNELYSLLLTVDANDFDRAGARSLEKTLSDFRRSGVDKKAEIRARIKELNEELIDVSQQFEQNISNDQFHIVLDSVDDLDGLPEDYIWSHVQSDGKFIITTNYPDYVPFMKYATNGDARKQLRMKFMNRGQNNGPVLSAMIQKRHELAQLLGYDSYANYVVEDKMIKNAAAIHSFIDKISAIAKPGADREFQELLALKKRDNSDATTIEGHEYAFLEEMYKKENFGFDSQSVRPYFSYNKVRDGLLQITSELFDIEYAPVENLEAWHESVEAYDVYDDSGKLGRIYLDMHPREGKYSHAAQFTLRNGYDFRQYPEGVLVCNFPQPSDEDRYALMEHSDVVTFFHEFGHLLHHVFAGRHDWAAFSGVATEWDFVEAPSQLLEEWAWSVDVLSRFALHYQTSEPIPAELVQKMRDAEEFGKALAVRQQMFYAALSLNYYDLDPSSFDPDELMKDLQEKYSYFSYEMGTHFNYSFGHLNGYSAMYYTYMWSLSLAKDLFEPFREQGLMNTDLAKRYRDLILSAGGSEDAITLVEQFLGRPFQFDAFERWLTGEDR